MEIEFVGETLEGSYNSSINWALSGKMYGVSCKQIENLCQNFVRVFNKCPGLAVSACDSIPVGPDFDSQQIHTWR